MEEKFVPSKAQTPMQGYLDHKESPNIIPPSESNKASGTDPKEVELYGLPENSK